jgi:hypothetical protein
MDIKPIAKRRGSRSWWAQTLFFRAGKRFARPDRRPLGRPGERPQGFGGFAGVPSSTKSAKTTRRTRTGVRWPGS